MATNNVIKKPKGAAAEYAKHSFSAYKRCTNGCAYCVSPDSLIFMYDGSTRKTFQTGAEWLAKQNEKHSFEAKVCKLGNVYLKEMDKDAISTALQDFNADEKVIVQIKKCDHGT